MIQLDIVCSLRRSGRRLASHEPKVDELAASSRRPYLQQCLGRVSLSLELSEYNGEIHVFTKLYYYCNSLCVMSCQTEHEIRIFHSSLPQEMYLKRSFTCGNFGAIIANFLIFSDGSDIALSRECNLGLKVHGNSSRGQLDVTHHCLILQYHVAFGYLRILFSVKERLAQLDLKSVTEGVNNRDHLGLFSLFD